MDQEIRRKAYYICTDFSEGVYTPQFLLAISEIFCKEFFQGRIKKSFFGGGGNHGLLVGGKGDGAHAKELCGKRIFSWTISRREYP